ncbi:MAG TPA: AlpA family phage regulatory protein [Acidiferrobacteraceae bacterium]|nr:AlpA family phage regulatory protein [Acidiferrobacteraceae bacterium]
MSKILRKNQVRELTGLSDRTIDRKEKAGEFPTRVLVSANAVGWREDEVNDWIDALQRGGPSAPVAALNARG